MDEDLKLFGYGFVICLVVSILCMHYASFMCDLPLRDDWFTLAVVLSVVSSGIGIIIKISFRIYEKVVIG